ncbi:AMP-binding protein [Actinoallomurus sp. NPDC050550]|uniref:(2,3-dihydroxybenzoyl)adenylate synthase n=1 Tax=Actinoallomurus sp. NPDC050550 TaxID=3154937 RepID=UPI0033D24B46
MTERYEAAGYWQGRPLGELVNAVADAAPDAVALVSGSVRMTYRELVRRADGAALRLLGLGLRPDDRIIMQLDNRWEFVVLTLACLRAGILPVMALPAHRRREISHLAERAEARALAVPAGNARFDHQDLARRIRAEQPGVARVLAAGDRPDDDTVDLRALCRPADDPDAARYALDAVAPHGRDVALFLLSGGTTGLPKLIARTHDDYAYNVRRSAEVSGFGPDTVYLAALPISHNFPLGCPGVLGALLSGGRVVVAPSPAPKRVFDLIERERVTVTAAVPAVAQSWLAFQETGPGHDLGSLRVLQVGGARLADEVAVRVRPTLGCGLQQVFGMAEGLLNFTRLDDSDEVVCHTQGRPISPDDEIAIVDLNGRPVPDGTPGVLLTRGPYTPRGYYRADGHNRVSFTDDGWYRTGDIVRRRPDGNLVVEGRDKDMINRAGEKISAEEVENLAYRVPGVALAAAVAMPDPDLGERVCLYVVLQPGARVELAEVRAEMERAEVAPYKLPERLVVVDELPRTNIGKLDKKALRTDLRDRLTDERIARSGY